MLYVLNFIHGHVQSWSKLAIQLLIFLQGNKKGWHMATWFFSAPPWKIFEAAAESGGAKEAKEGASRDAVEHVWHLLKNNTEIDT